MAAFGGLGRLLLVALAALRVGAAGASEEPNVLAGVQRLVDAGAPELALSRVELLQPRSADRSGWAEWESLRIQLLEGLDRPAELLKRASALPDDAPADLARRALLAGAGAGTRIGEPAQARSLLARLFWQWELPPEVIRDSRMMVIGTYLGEKRPADAYRAMLRFQQDYQPLARAEGEHFAVGLAAQGAFREAATWLVYLDAGSAPRLLVELEAGLVSPENATVKARAVLKKAASADWWRVLGQAAGKEGDAGLELEALEHLLNYPGAENAISPAVLRKQYDAFADEIANREHLLRGEDSAWLNLAASTLPSSPPSARAILAVLSVRGSSPVIREAALEQWLESMQRQKLGLAAARYVVGLSELSMDALPAGARRSLGEAALAAGEAALACEYWRGLSGPDGVSPEAWGMRVASAAVIAGRFDDADLALEPVFAGSEPLGNERAQGLLGLARRALTKEQSKRAEAWLAVVAARAAGNPRREALTQLAQIAEGHGEYRLAAERYLQAAVTLDLKVPDAASVHARWGAARCLALAGYRVDALSQYERIQKSLKDRGLREFIRLEMDRL